METRVEGGGRSTSHATGDGRAQAGQTNALGRPICREIRTSEAPNLLGVRFEIHLEERATEALHDPIFEGDIRTPVPPQDRGLQVAGQNLRHLRRGERGERVGKTQGIVDVTITQANAAVAAHRQSIAIHDVEKPPGDVRPATVEPVAPQIEPIVTVAHGARQATHLVFLLQNSNLSTSTAGL